MMICKFNNLKLILDFLNNNKAVLMETDTVLGLFSKNLDLIYEIKQRPKEKKVVLLIKNVNQIPNANLELQKLAKKFWPGKLTIIYNNISYRIPNHQKILEILNEVSWLYCSSANISGENTFANTEQAINKFFDSKQKSNLLIVEGKSYSSLPSTIYNLDTHKIVRVGEISIEQIKQALEGE